MKPKKVALVIADYPVYEKFCPHFSGMQDGLKVLGIEYRVFSCRPSFYQQELIDYAPDFVLYCLLDMVKNVTARKLIRTSLPDAKIVFWYGDLRNKETGQVICDMSEIDMMFISNDGQRDFYKEIWKVPDCLFLPLGATIQNVKYDKNFDFDFVFIGGRITRSVFTERAVQISKYRKYGLRIINADGHDNPALRARILKTMPVIYHSSKLSLDISHFTDIKGYTSNRFWNIGAAGGVALTKRFPGCEEFYPEDSRLYFDNFGESIELLTKYTSHPELLEPIRKRALQEAKRHTYDKRLLEMFAKIYN